MNCITDLYYAKVLVFIAKGSTSKGGFKLLYAPTFSKAAEEGKQGATSSVKEFHGCSTTSKGIHVFPPSPYHQLFSFFF